MPSLENKYAIIILAAGSSSRLGRPKQLVKINGETLLNRTISNAIESKVGDVFVVLGCSESLIIPTLPNNTNIISNSQWSMGMGKSISVAVDTIKSENYSGVVLLLCDQIHLDVEHIQNLVIAHSSTKKGIVVSNYKKGQGPPVFFSCKYFSDLSKLDDDLGAKLIIKDNRSDREKIPFQNGNIDLDTLEDLDRIL